MHPEQQPQPRTGFEQNRNKATSFLNFRKAQIAEITAVSDVCVTVLCSTPVVTCQGLVVAADNKVSILGGNS